MQIKFSSPKIYAQHICHRQIQSKSITTILKSNYRKRPIYFWLHCLFNTTTSFCMFVMWCLKTTEKLKCLKSYKSYIDFSLCYKNKVFMHLIPLLVNSVEWMFIGFLDILSVRSGRYQITNWICVMGFKARAYIRF